MKSVLKFTIPGGGRDGPGPGSSGSPGDHVSRSFISV